MTSIYSPSLSSFFLARSPSSPLSPPGVMVPDIEEGELPMGISCSPPTSSSNSEPRKGEALLPLPAPPLPPRGRDPYDLGHGAASHHSATHHVHRSSHRSSLAMEVVRGKIPPSPTATLSPPSTSSSTSSSPASCSSHLDENLQLSEFNWNDFEILQKVGEGTTGSVYKARHCPSPGVYYALKVFRPEPDTGVSISALQEIKSFQRLRSLKYIVGIIGYAFTSKNEFVLIEEYMEHDLAGLMHSKKRFNEPQIKCIMHQLISGLAECHEIGLIHRDMKSSNILMHQGNLRITDFGFMTTVENAARYHSHEIITLWYRPPELLLGTKTYGQEVDIWSVGCIFFELLTGEIAFRGREPKDQIALLFRTLGTPTEAQWPGVSSLPLWGELARNLPPYPNTLRERLGPRVSAQAYDLLSSLLSLDPKQRITAKKALAHPFFTHGVAPCKPSELPRFKEAHEYELKKAHNAIRNGRTTASGGQPRPPLLQLPSGAVPPVETYRRVSHPDSGRASSHGIRQREETRKRPAPDVDWILNREKASAKPHSTSPTGTMTRSQHETKRLKAERELPASSRSISPKREPSVPRAAKSDVQRAKQRQSKPSASVRGEPKLASANSHGPSNGAPLTKTKLIQPLRKSSPTRRLPSLPMSSLPVRRVSSSPPPAPAAASSKITIRRSKVGDKPVLRIVNPEGSPPASPPAKLVAGPPPASDAYREPHKKRRSPSGGQRHARKVSQATDPASPAAYAEPLPEQLAGMRRQRSSDRHGREQPSAKRQQMAKRKSSHAGELYCTCRQPNDPSRWMIACDWCDCWYHGECEGVTQEESQRMDKYKCRRCRGLVAN